MDSKYKIAIIGGKLQGTEAVYLARKAGYHSVLIDRNPKAPASALCNEFFCGDVSHENTELLKLLLDADLILPAMENEQTIDCLKSLSERYPLRIAFDFQAYSISSSKQDSDKIFHNHDIPAPVYYPRGKPPYIAKPSGESGSTGVQSLAGKEEAELFLSNPEADDEWIIQEQLNGPSYSIEIIGRPGAYRTYQITRIHMDDSYDCNQVTCPCAVTEAQKKAFEDMAFKIAEIIGLHGIMDLEVIDDGGVFKIIEIDARIPSQTPTAVYHSTGINLLSEIVDLYMGKWDNDTGLLIMRAPKERFCSYEHHYISQEGLESPGEHIMGAAGPLQLYPGLFGCDEVISDYVAGDKELRATFINSGENLEELEGKRSKMMEALDSFQIEKLMVL